MYCRAKAALIKDLTVVMVLSTLVLVEYFYHIMGKYSIRNPQTVANLV